MTPEKQLARSEMRQEVYEQWSQALAGKDLSFGSSSGQNWPEVCCDTGANHR
jgi:hypothetical protein